MSFYTQTMLESSVPKHLNKGNKIESISTYLRKGQIDFEQRENSAPGPKTGERGLLPGLSAGYH